METVEFALPTLTLEETNEQTTRPPGTEAPGENKQCSQLVDVSTQPRGGFPAEALSEWARQQEILERCEAEIKAMEGLIEDVAAQYGIVRTGEAWIIESVELSIEDEEEAQVILQLLWTGYDIDQLRRGRESEKEDGDVEEDEADSDGCEHLDEGGDSELPDYEDDKEW